MGVMFQKRRTGDVLFSCDEPVKGERERERERQKKTKRIKKKKKVE